MATTTVYLKGKCKWAHTMKPDKYGRYSVVLYPDPESLEKVHTLKNGKPAILNELKKDDEGFNIKFSCDLNKNIGGKIYAFNVEVFDSEDKPFHNMIGNGSDVTIKLDVYSYRRGEGKACRLKAIRIDNLVPYEMKRDFTEEQHEAAEILEQPKPVWG